MGRLPATSAGMRQVARICFTLEMPLPINRAGEGAFEAAGLGQREAAIRTLGEAVIGSH
ncbi:MAG: hypothetical protein OET79_09825 [Nitrospirota bacterium]|nr:hypothetical protein [Nitrospirota bacterium]